MRYRSGRYLRRFVSLAPALLAGAGGQLFASVPLGVLPQREATVCLAAVLQGLFEGEGLWEQLYQSK